MICPTCRGRQFVPDGPAGDDDEAIKMKPCPDCIGGIASCCDAAGAGEAAYRDDTCPERLCDRCGTLYRGPAVYCSLNCALEERGVKV
jgi:hypothetical protein